MATSTLKNPLTSGLGVATHSSNPTFQDKNRSMSSGLLDQSESQDFYRQSFEPTPIKALNPTFNSKKNSAGGCTAS